MRRTVEQLLKIPVVKKYKKFRIIKNGSNDEILDREEVIEKYRNFEVLGYTDYLDGSTLPEIRVEYDYEKIKYWDLHSLIESLQELEEQYGGKCKIVPEVYDKLIPISYNKTLSNEIRLCIKKTC